MFQGPSLMGVYDVDGLKCKREKVIEKGKNIHFNKFILYNSIC